MKYSEQLQQSEWDDLRFEVFYNAGFKCEKCGYDPNRRYAKCQESSVNEYDG